MENVLLVRQHVLRALCRTFFCVLCLTGWARRVFTAGATPEWDPRAMINGGDAANGASPLHLAAAVSHKEMVRGRQPSCSTVRRSHIVRVFVR